MRKSLYLTLALVAAVAMLAGCDSDSTTPNDELPALTNEDVATQTGYVTTALTENMLEIVFAPSSSKDLGEYDYTFDPATGIVGTVHSEFRTDGPTGDLTDYDSAGWCRVYTTDDLVLTVEALVEGFESDVTWTLGFNLTATIAGNTATISGTGALGLGDFTPTFTVDEVVVLDGNDLPQSGTLTFVNSGITATVTFDGGNLVTLTIGTASWQLNVDEGTITAV